MKSGTFLLAASLLACGDNSHTQELQELQATVDDLESELTAALQERDALQAERDALASKVAMTEPAITLEVPLKFGSEALALGTPYDIGGGNTLSFREVRYWLTNVSLKKADGTFVAVADPYFLVEARGEQLLSNGTEAEITLPATRREAITLKGVPAGNYVGIKFDVGVDPAHNDDLSQTAGELHTLKNMTFDNGWMWFTSYIFTKTRADLAGTGGAAVVSWDNGSNADLREVALDFPAALEMKGGAAYKVTVNADLATVVSAVSPQATPGTRVVIGAGEAADRTVLADGFRDMFVMASAAAVP